MTVLNNVSMKFIALMILMSFHYHSRGQTELARLKILDIKYYDGGYLLEGLKVENKDTIYFISLKDTSCKKGFRKIKIGNEYDIEIKDMDQTNGSFPSPLPNGYYLKFGKYYLKRVGRDGRTFNTTQYISKNLNGLYIK